MNMCKQLICSSLCWKTTKIKARVVRARLFPDTLYLARRHGEGFAKLLGFIAQWLTTAHRCVA
jgi:hypothetical protein